MLSPINVNMVMIFDNYLIINSQPNYTVILALQSSNFDQQFLSEMLVALIFSCVP